MRHGSGPKYYSFNPLFMISQTASTVCLALSGRAKTLPVSRSNSELRRFH